MVTPLNPAPDPDPTNPSNSKEWPEELQSLMPQEARAPEPPDARSEDDQRLNWLFVDMNSYFASVEQDARPELRGQPVAIVPMMADTTCCIAASYEAKAYGVKTGTVVGRRQAACAPAWCWWRRGTSFMSSTITASSRPWRAACR